MSTSTLYQVFKTTARHLAVFQNGLLTAPPLWRHLPSVYLGREPDAWLSDGNPHWLWDACEDVRIPEFLRIAHAFTFDLALCRPEYRARLADACRRTQAALLEDQIPCALVSLDLWPHWGSIADSLLKRRDGRSIGFGLGGTSVNEPVGELSWERRDLRRLQVVRRRRAEAVSGLVEYRVVWKREDCKRWVKRFARRAKADALAALLRATSPEEVLALKGLDPEGYDCCSGRECGCGGATHLEREEAYFAGLMPLEYCSIEERTIGEWRPA